MTKKIIYITAIVAVFASCVRSNTDGLSKSTDITSFVLTSTNKTIGKLSVKYTLKKINDNTALISLTDSLKYGTNLDSLILNVGGSKLSSIKIFESAGGVKLKEFNGLDRIPDTINFSDTVYIQITSENKKEYKEYKVKLFAHKNDPDLYNWKPIASEIYANPSSQEKLILRDSTLLLYVKNGGNVLLYTSIKGDRWQQQTLNNFPNNIDLKYITKTKDSIFIAEGSKFYSSSKGFDWKQTTVTKSIDHILFELNNEIYAIEKAVMKLYKFADKNWQEVQLNTSSGILPNEFPVSGASVWSDFSKNGNGRVYIVGGEDKNGKLLNSVWSSEDGAYWVNTNNSGQTTLFTPRKDATAYQYDSKLFVIGGTDANGLITNNIFIFSPDFGITWATPPANMSLPTIFVPRYNVQIVYMSNKARVYIVGGQTSNSNFVKDVWVGAKNMLLWELATK